MPALTPMKRNGPLPLSFAQQRLWFLAQMQGASQAYHIPLGFRLAGELDGDALHRALDRIIARHEALRTSFDQIDGQPVQRIASEDCGFALREHDLRQNPDIKEELQRLTIEEANTAFDLQAGPLIRGRLIRLGDREHVLLITMHHIVSDGWSMGVLTRELGTLYRAYSQGQADPLPALTIQYADYAVWQRQGLIEDVLQGQANYWRRRLTGAPAVLELATDRRRPPRQDYAGAFVALELDEELTTGLKALSRSHGATLFMTLLAGWAALMCRLSGQDDVVIGIPTAQRSYAEVEPLIGFFINTLALRLDLSGERSVGELLQHVKARTLEALQYQDVPFEQVVDIVRPTRSLAYTPIFQVVFTWQNSGVSELELPCLRVAPVTPPHSFAKFDLTLDLVETDGRVTGGLEYATALFDRATVERYAQYLRRLLEGMVKDGSYQVAHLSMLSDAERQQLLVDRNATEAEYPQKQCVHELFEAQAAKTPDAIALEYGDLRLTYAELNVRANRLAHQLRMLGVKPDALVAICIERSLEMIVGLLAILKAGGAYVPLDPDSPGERVSFILKDCAPIGVLTNAHEQVRLCAALHRTAREIPIIDLDADAEAWAGQPASNPDRTSVGLTSRHLAYVIYTSGSTGHPKGVMVTHRNLVSSTFARTKTYGGYGRFLLLSPVSFDSSVAGIFGTLTSGGSLVIATREAVRDPSRLNDDISKFRVETLLCVPALYRQILEFSASGSCERSLSKIIVAGEICPPDLVSKSAKVRPQALFFNEYGPTETTVWSSMWPADPAFVKDLEEHTSVPIGRPIPNTRIYILDRHGEPVPYGVTGEICIGGAGVARGYLNRPELTAERFVADPFAAEPGARMYKSGDLGRYLPDGNIEFLGRNDFQVKIRGFRVELGEIEARLTQHPGVRQAVVLAREGESGDKRLVAYVVPELDSVHRANELEAFLKERLPGYMVPSAFVLLKTLPLTLNGKVDRQALPAPGQARERGTPSLAPRDQLEFRLTRLWEKILGVRPISVRDSFFDLGGHSLLAVRLMAQIEQQFSKPLPLALLFEAPTVEQLAHRLRQNGWSAPLSLLIPVQPNGSRPPFFCVHGPGIGSLAQYVNPDQPLYTLQPYGLDGRRAPATVEEMAEGYLREIRLLQPDGPYFLGGFSAGALIAFEMAQQLHKQAQEIGLLILLDPCEPANHAFCAHDKSTDTGSSAKLVAITSFMLRRWADLRYPKFKEKLLYVLTRTKDAVGKAQIAFYFNIGRRLPPYVRQFYALNVLYQIQKEYRPQTYPGPVVLFRTKQNSPDCHATWGRLAAGGLQVHEIAGGHLEIFDEPYLQSWVKQFVSYLNHASKTQGDQILPHDRFSMTS